MEFFNTDGTKGGSTALAELEHFGGTTPNPFASPGLDRTQLTRELLSPAPRGLLAIDGEVIFAGGQAIFHHKDQQTGREIFKYISFRSLAAAFSETAIDSGWLPPGVVRYGVTTQGEWFVYFVKGKKTKLTIERKNIETGQTEMVALEVALPSMVMICHDNVFRVFAVKGNKFSSKAQLHAAPLSNLGGDGAVCWGDNPRPEPKVTKANAAWKLFIGSPFNNHLDNGKSKAEPQSVLRMLEKVAEEGLAHWPEEDMAEVVQGNSYDRKSITVGQYVAKQIVHPAGGSLTEDTEDRGWED